MEKWSRRNIRVEKLIVNPRNPRFNPVANPNKAIELMLKEKSSGIKKIGRDIALRGLNPSKNFIVEKSKNGNFLVLEGNRRVVSVKLLNDPNKAKDKSLKKFFKNLKEQYNGNIPKTLECVVYENKNDASARHWIALEHTGKNKGIGIDPWNSEQTSRFKAQFHDKKPSRSIQIFDFADDNGLIRNKVKLTNLQRLLSNPTVCEVIGIDFPKGKLVLQKSKSHVKRNLRRIFSHMSKDEFKVSLIYTTKEKVDWTNNVLKSNNHSKEIQATQTLATIVQTLPKSTSRKHLIPEDFKVLIKEPRINDIYKELQDDLFLDNSKKSVPNAVGVLFRVFLEVSLDYYLRKKMGKQPSRERTISQKIVEVAEYMESSGIATKSELSAIRKTSGTKNTDILHIDRFHEYVHSSTIQPESDALKAKWNNLQRFFEVLWKSIEEKKTH